LTTYLGKDGTVRVNGATLASVLNFRIEETGDTIDVSHMGTVARTNVSSLSSFVGGMSVWWDPLDASGQSEIVVGAEITFSVYTSGDTTPARYYYGSGIIISATIQASFDSAIEYIIGIQGSGSLVNRVTGFLLLETGSFMLQESAGKILTVSP
jgi:hypothetical protein